jgi:CBS domain-containing protein
MNYLLKVLLITILLLTPIQLRGIFSSDSIHYTDNSPEIQFFQTLSYNTSPLKIATTNLVKLLLKMSETRINSAIITEQNVPVWMVTDTRTLQQIATGRFLI